MKPIFQSIILGMILSLTFVSSHAQTSLTPWTSQQVIDEHIAVPAQRAILRMLKGNLLQQKIASDLLSAVKNGHIEGIYLVDQGVPALRAKDIGIGWWEIIPKGQLITCMTKPNNRPPLLALSKTVAKNPTQVDQALGMGWGMLLDTQVETQIKSYDISTTRRLVEVNLHQVRTSLLRIFTHILLPH